MISQSCLYVISWSYKLCCLALSMLFISFCPCPKYWLQVWTHQVGNLSVTPSAAVIAEQPHAYNGSFNPYQVCLLTTQ